MTLKLIQKAFLKGTREFEIVEDTVFVRIKSLGKEEKLTVTLSTLDPEPVINGSELVFYSRHHGRPVLSLLINKPSTEAFARFVDTLKHQIINEFPEAARPEAPGWNVYEEPPEFGEADETREKASFVPVNPDRLEADITMLKTYLNQEDLRPLLDALETLKAAPENEAAFQNLLDAFNKLGINQGAVLTYAPYLKVLLSKSYWS